MDLATVAKLVADGKPDRALAMMLAVWRKRPLPRLADAIDAANRLVDTPWGPLFRDKADVDSRTTRVSKLGGQPRDPRFARALLDYLREMPFTSNGSRSFWSTVFVCLSKLGDPRAITAIPEIRKGWNIRPLQREWLDAQADWLAAAYATSHPDGAPIPSAAESKLLTAIERAIAAAVPVGGDPRRDALLAEIYAHPSEDGPRTVLADHFTSTSPRTASNSSAASSPHAGSSSRTRWRPSATVTIRRGPRSNGCALQARTSPTKHSRRRPPGCSLSTL